MPRTFQVQNVKNRLASAFLSSHSKFPDRNALHINDVSYSYAKLMDMASGIALQLKEKVTGPRIAIYCTHSAWTYASVLAVTLIGGSYVPLSPKNPIARLQEVIYLCEPSLLLTEEEVGLEVEQMSIGKDVEGSVEFVSLFQSPEAYLLFTSGTTGKPKGVPITHVNLEGFFDHFSTFDFNEEDRFIQSFELSFDVSVMMMFLCWGAGACLYPVSPEGHKPFNVLNCIRENRLTVCGMVPSLLSYIEKYLPGMNMPHVRHTFFAGERLTVHQAQVWQNACPGSTLFNAYGPSEGTIVCMAHRYDPADRNNYGSDVPIGKTFAGTLALLFDEHLDRVLNSQGEICLSGTQVITHYLNHQEEDRFFTHAGKKFYRTGDLGYFDQNGELVFAGRVDGQMKINGYRIEPSEIIRAVELASGLNAEIVVVKEMNEAMLVAFIEGGLLPEGLSEKLLKLLPSYMVPGKFIPIKKLPLGTHDKVDKKRLVQLYNERNHT